MRNRKRALYYKMNIESNKNENSVRGRSYYVKFILAPTVLCFLILQAVLHFLPAAVPGVLQTEFTFNLASLTACSCLLALFCYYGTKFYLPWWRRSMIFFAAVIFPPVSLIYVKRLQLLQIFPNYMCWEALIFLGCLLGIFLLTVLSRELTLYLFFGALTTVVSVGSFSLFAHILSLFAAAEWLIPQILSFVISVIFAFWVNRKYVFSGKGIWWQELQRFVFSRLFSGFVIEFALMAFLVEICRINQDWAKIATAFLVVVCNYILSKFFVFMKK